MVLNWLVLVRARRHAEGRIDVHFLAFLSPNLISSCPPFALSYSAFQIPDIRDTCSICFLAITILTRSHVCQICFHDYYFTWIPWNGNICMSSLLTYLSNEAVSDLKFRSSGNMESTVSGLVISGLLCANSPLAKEIPAELCCAMPHHTRMWRTWCYDANRSHPATVSAVNHI